MAAATPAWQDVLDQADDATAALIIKLQMLDVQELAAVEANHSFAVSDLELACRDMEVELRRCRHDRGLPEDLDPVAVAAEAITSQQQMHIQYVDCSSCSGSFPSPDIKQVRCEDWYCPVCLEQLFRLSMMDKSLYPPRCCQQTIPLEDVRTFLPRELVLEFAAKKEELDDHQPLYCRIKSCSAYIGVKNRIGRWACCAESDCSTTTCTEGDHAPHNGACPPDVATQQVLEVAAQQGWRACPRCRMLVELTIGCNHMTCLCRAEFCYICGDRWKTCDCPQWDEHRLFARARAVAERENQHRGRVNAAQVQTAAQDLRENHECGHPRRMWRKVDVAHERCEWCNQRLPQYIFRCDRCHSQACWRCMRNRI